MALRPSRPKRDLVVGLRVFEQQQAERLLLARALHAQHLAADLDEREILSGDRVCVDPPQVPFRFLGELLQAHRVAVRPPGLHDRVVRRVRLDRGLDPVAAKDQFSLVIPLRRDLPLLADDGEGDAHQHDREHQHEVRHAPLVREPLTGTGTARSHGGLSPRAG